MRAFRSITCIFARLTLFRGIVVRRFTIMLLVSAAVACQQSTYSQTANAQEKPMKHYALVFYPSHTLTPGELKQRQIEILEWVKDVKSMGIDLDPRAFGSPLARLAPSGGEAAASGDEGAGSAFTNIVFFDSASEEQAMHVAKMHPGLRYGTTIEVREWTPPRAATSRP